MTTSIFSIAVAALVLVAPLAGQTHLAGVRPDAGGISRTLKQERRRLESVRADQKKATALVRKALVSRSSSRAIASLKRAKSYLDRAVTRLNRYRLIESKDPVISGLSAELFGALRERAVETSLHLAAAYNVRGSYSKALHWSNTALSMEPKSQKALEQRARVEQSASERGYYPPFRFSLRRAVIPWCGHGW